MNHIFPRRWIGCALGTLLSLAGCPPALAGGGGQGLTPTGNYVVPSRTQKLDRFGNALAVGDFDGNGIPDLAVGSPGGAADAYRGRVDVFLSSGVALAYAGSYVGNPDSLTGSSLAAGDFDGDHIDELAVGVPGETLAPQVGAGKVVILAWKNAQLTVVASFAQSAISIGETPESYDNFGAALASGDFDGNGADDLAIGVPYEQLSAPGDEHGLVHVLYGKLNVGLTASGAQIWTQDSPGIYGNAYDQDHFGFALAAGRFDGDAFDDLAIGVPGEPAGTSIHSGGVNVLYGTGTSGLTATRNQLWVVGSGGVPGNPPVVQWFGRALCAADFDGDGIADLAVGAPYADPYSVADAGMVWELHGGATGITATGSHVWTAIDLTGTLGASGDYFGYALACGSFDGGLEADLAIGSPGADPSGLSSAGVVDVMSGGMGGLTAFGAQRFSSAGLASGPAAVNQFLGSALAAGDFDDNGHADLAVGIPNRVLGVQILRGDSDVLFFDRFETGNTQMWSAKVP